MIVGKLMVVLGLDSTGFNTGLSSATGKTTAFAKATDKTFKAISKAAKIGLLAISAAFIKGTVDAAKFEKSLANVATMLDKKTLPMMEDFEKALLAMSEEFGESTSTLAKGLFDILSASIPAAKALDVLEVSAMAAQAGLTDTGVAADAITTLMNSFGDATKDAQFWSDILFATVKFGKTTFAELAPVIGNVAKMMEVAGGTGEEMAAMLAIMTRNGIQTRVAVTSLRGVVSALIKPSEELTEELGGMTVKADGFRAVMDKIGSLPATDLAKMFPNIRALTGVVVAAQDLGAEVLKIQDLMAEGSPTLAAFEIQTNTLAFTWNQFKKTLTATSVTIGNELLPTINAVLKDTITWLQENREEFASFARITLQGIKDILNFMFKFKEVLLGLGSAILGLMVIQKVTALMNAFGIATSLSLGPVSAIAFAIGGLIAVFFKLRSEMRKLKDDQELIDEAMKGNLQSTEDYNDAIVIQKARIQDIIATHMKINDAISSRSEVRGRDSALAEQAHKDRLKEARDDLAIIMGNADAKKERDEAEKKRAEEKAMAEQQAFFDEQKRISESLLSEENKASALRQLELERREALAEAEEEAERIAEEEKKRLEDLAKAREDQINSIKMSLFLLRETEKEHIERRTAELEELGFGYQDIIDVIKMEFPKAYEAAEIASVNYFNAEDRRIGNWQEKIEEAAESFKDKFIRVTKDVQVVFSQMYSAITGTTNQYFNNLFSKLDTEEARRKKDARDTIKDEDELAAALTAIDEDMAKKRYDLELKQFKVTKALNIAQALMNTAEAVSKALTLIWPLNLAIAALVGGLGAVQVGLIAGQEPPPSPFIRGGLIEKMINGGVFSGKPGIDTNTIAVTSGEFIMPPQQTLDNIDELESIRSGGGGKSLTINPMPLNIEIEGRSVFKGMVEFMTDESDRGTFRINPKVIGALT